jgi:hypothetical protein
MEGRFSVADAHVDKTEYDANFALIKKFEDEAKAAGTLDKDAELLWRLARAYVLKSENASDKTEQEQLAREALNYARRSLQAEDTPLGHKWVAIGLGRIGDFLPTKEKIESAFEIKVSVTEQHCKCVLVSVFCLICLFVLFSFFNLSLSSFKGTRVEGTAD